MQNAFKSTLKQINKYENKCLYKCIHSLKQMKAIVSEQKPESSVKECHRKCKQRSNLLLINSPLATKFMTENSDAYSVY